ncbi:MAG: hypothetical protein ACOH2N_12305 [Devosia sp.]
MPDISLKDYTCNAVIDWIKIDLQLQRVTQHQWLRDAFAECGRRPFIVPIHAGAGNESAHFEIKVQEPDLSALRKAVAAIEHKHGLASQPTVIGMEVSVDFTPKKPSDDARARMVGMLSRQLAPNQNVYSKRSAMPRVSWGVGHRWARVQEPGAGSFNDPYRFAVNEFTSVPGADTTSYFGAKGSDDMVRVMDKIVDEQNTHAGTFRALPPEEQRCRIEVTLKQAKLASMGIKQLDDVALFKFATLQGAYFQFKLATVPSRHVSVGPVTARLERQRVQKFLMTGICGLVKMDQTRLEHYKKTRPAIRKDLASRGRHLAGHPRAGSGPNGTAVAFEDLCKTVQTALANLSRRLRTEASDAGA